MYVVDTARRAVAGDTVLLLRGNRLEEVVIYHSGDPIPDVLGVVTWRGERIAPTSRFA
jgi:hypothetical protein